MHGLSKEAKQEVVRALERATELIDSGQHPTAAVIKVAQTQKLSAGHARLVALAYNTGRVGFQRDTGDGTIEKIADFELADPELVADTVAQTIKRAEQPPDSVSSEYSRPPTFATEQYRQDAAVAFELPKLAKAPTPPLPRDPARETNLACSDVRSWQRKVATARSLVDKLHRQLDQQLDQLTTQFRVVGSPALATIRKYAEYRGDAATASVLTEIGRRCPMLTRQPASQAAVMKQAELLMYEQVSQCARQAAEVVSGNKLLQQIQAQSAVKIAEMLDGLFLAEPTEDPFHDINAAAVKTASPNIGRIIAPFVGGMAGGAARSHREGTDENVRAYLAALDDPAHEQRMNAIRARTTAEQLMTQDPVLKGYSQDELVGAYNQLAQAVPSAAAQPLYMQSMMRRYLGQGGMLDPDDVRTNVLDLEHKLTENRMRPMPATPEVPRFTGGNQRRNAVNQVMQSLGAPMGGGGNFPEHLQGSRQELSAI